MIDEKMLKNEEKAIISLRSLYIKYGYKPFKMSKFEEYELYLRNKNFLVDDRIITFNDTNGKLLALKPDVTLSIIKNIETDVGCKQKLCYNENVYRVSARTKQFKEIMQTGLECIGDVDLYDIFETVFLASESLKQISNDFELDVSHLGVISAILDEVCDNESFKKEALKYIGEKNVHDLERICEEYGVEDGVEELKDLVLTYGDVDEVISKIENISESARFQKSISELKALSKMLNSTDLKSKIRLDFSVINDMSYYNGIVFKGFLQGICEGVLSGGQYDKLMNIMGKKAGAIGFAIYLDLLESLPSKNAEFDVDNLVIYDDKTQLSEVLETVQKLVENGKSTTAQKAVPSKMTYRNIVDLRKGGEQ